MKCVPLTEGPREVARRHLADAGNGWSVGTWGAIGEFQYDAEEPGLVLDLVSLSATSPRGALHIGDLGDAELFALVDEAGRTREIAFCSPRPAARRTTIHDAGPCWLSYAGYLMPIKWMAKSRWNTALACITHNSVEI